MRKVIFGLLLLILMATPVNALEFSAPSAPEAVQKYLPGETQNFSDDLRYVIRAIGKEIQPHWYEAKKTCMWLVAVCLLLSVLTQLDSKRTAVVDLVGAISVTAVLIHPTKSMIRLGAEIVVEMSNYGKLLLPVMTAAMAAQGGVTKSGALYAGTAFFDAVLISAISNLLVPLLYIFLCICMVSRTFSQPVLTKIHGFLKWLITWGLKIVLYIFTGYISITGVVGGATDAAMLKATKLTISGMVPVVGSILSDASEAVLVSAGVMKTAVGTYGLLVVLALWLGPFLEIGIQYMMLKITSGICGLFGTKQVSLLIKDYSDIMSLILAMTGTMCLIILISIICFMKGVG